MPQPTTRPHAPRLPIPLRANPFVLYPLTSPTQDAYATVPVEHRPAHARPQLRTEDLVENLVKNNIPNGDVARLIYELTQAYSLPFRLAKHLDPATQATSKRNLTKPWAALIRKQKQGTDLITSGAVMTARLRKAKRLTTGRHSTFAIGSVSDKMIDDLTINNHYLHAVVRSYPQDGITYPDKLRAAALTYALIKLAVVQPHNLHLPYNRPLLTTIRHQSPTLHALLTTDHAAHLTATYPWLMHLQPQPAPTHGVPRRHVPEAPPDDAAQQAIDTLINHQEFAACAHALDLYLQHTAQIAQTVNDRPMMLINAELISNGVETVQATEHLEVTRYVPVLFTSTLDGDLPVMTCHLSRLLLTTALHRHDLWYGWKGEHDKRYFIEHKMRAVRGSQNRHIGWMCDKIDDLFTMSQCHCDVNPYSIKNYAIDLADDHRPFTRSKDHRSMEAVVLADTPVYDYVVANWAGNVDLIDNYLEEGDE